MYIRRSRIVLWTERVSKNSNTWLQIEKTPPKTWLDRLKCKRSGQSWSEIVGSKNTKSCLDRLISQRGHLIQKLKAKDSTKKWAYYFVLVHPLKEALFMDALDSDQMINLEDYGQVIASNYGEEPNNEVKTFLKEKYNFDV